MGIYVNKYCCLCVIGVMTQRRGAILGIWSKKLGNTGLVVARLPAARQFPEMSRCSMPLKSYLNDNYNNNNNNKHICIAP